MMISIKTTCSNLVTFEKFLVFCGYLKNFTLDVKKIAKNPPKVPFIGKQLTYKAVSGPVTGSCVHPRLERHRASDPTDLSSINESSVKFQRHNEDLPPPSK